MMRTTGSHSADQIQQNDDREGDTYEPEDKGHDDLQSLRRSKLLRLARFPRFHSGTFASV